MNSHVIRKRLIGEPTTRWSLSPRRFVMGLVYSLALIVGIIVSAIAVGRPNSLLIQVITLALVVTWVLLFCRPAWTRVQLVTSAVFGTCAGGATVAGLALNGQLAAAGIAASAWVGIVSAVAWMTLLLGLIAFLQGQHRTIVMSWYSEIRPAFKAILWAVVMLLVWLPGYLHFYPGALSYDVSYQTQQAVGTKPLSNLQTVAHTVFWGFFVRFGRATGNEELGLALYGASQMVLLALLLTLALVVVARAGVGPVGELACFGWFALFPLTALFSFLPTKDTLFTGFFALFTAFLVLAVVKWDCLKSRWPVLVMAGASAFAMCLFRNNGVYVVVLLTVVLFCAARGNRRCVAVTGASVFVVTFVVTGPLWSALRIDGTLPRESLSVPMQQLAYVFKHHSSAELKAAGVPVAEVNHYFRTGHVQSNFNPRISDPVKRNFSSGRFSARKAGFLRVYLTTCAAYPGDCIREAAEMTLGYWSPVSHQPDSYARRDYIEVFMRDLPDFRVHRSASADDPGSFYVKVARGDIQDWPVIGVLSSLGATTWLYVGVLLAFVLTGKRKLVVAVLPSLALVLTLLLGPAALIRYVYPCMVCFGIVAAVVLGVRYGPGGESHDGRGEGLSLTRESGGLDPG